MTPCTKDLKRNKIDFLLHEYIHDNSSTAYGLEASQKLQVNANKIYKTLIVEDEHSNLYVSLLSVSDTLNMKQLAKILKVKKVSMVDTKKAQKSSAYILGAISPIGQKKKLKTIIDLSAKEQETIYVSAGRRGLEVELNPFDLQKITDATFECIT